MEFVSESEPLPDGVRDRVSLRLAFLLGIALCLTPGPTAVRADEAAGPDTPEVAEDDPTFPVSQFVLQYGTDHPDQPPLDAFLPKSVELSEVDGALAGPGLGTPVGEVVIDGEPQREVRLFRASALGTIAAELLRDFHDRGYLGVYISPHPADIDVDREQDLRRDGDTVLRLVVTTGRVSRLRTLASGSRIESEWRVDNQLHRRIRQRSPIQPSGAVSGKETDLVRKDLLEDYLHQLNRHPGRRVEASLAASEDGQGIDLDYHVHESKPWLVYAESSNTGTPETATWQTRIGFVDRQLTNRDDILAVEYTNGRIDRVNSVRASYEAPWFSRERPGWLKRSAIEPAWISWLDRDAIPWWGYDKLRWRIDGAWTRYKVRDVDISENDQFIGEDWHVGLEANTGIFQYGAFFLDTYASFRTRHVDVQNVLQATRGKTFVFEPELGLRFERYDEVSSLYGTTSFLYAMTSGNKASLADLGRPGANAQWPLLQWDIGGSHYLEPLLYPGSWKDLETPNTSTLAHELYLGSRGQYAFGKVLIPQVSQVVGGLYSVRGYPSSEAVGDDVYTGTIEYRFHLANQLPIRREPIDIPWLGSFRLQRQQAYGRPDWDLILRGFVDAGYTQRNTNALSAPGADSQFLLGVGAGVELRLLDKFSARADWGHSLRSIECGSFDDGSPIPCGPTKKGNNEFYFQFIISY